MGDAGTVVATVYCGDNYVATNEDKAASAIVDTIAGFQPDVVVAGPSFGSGRYGLACGLVASRVAEVLGVPVVTAMFPEAPGAERYRAAVPIVATTETATGMGSALQHLARIAVKLGAGGTLGSAKEEGLIPRGIRKNMFLEKTGAERAVDLLLKKLVGDEYETEWPLPKYDKVTAPAPITAGEPVLVALVTEAGVVPKGNPDRIPSGWASTFGKYDISSLDDLTPDNFETIHGGFDTSKANDDPDRLVPLDAARALEREGKIKLYPYLYSTTGNMGSIKTMSGLGAEIAADLISAGVQAVIVGAT
jgi:glycine reductase